MYKRKYSPEESLERVKLMMGYDLKNTLKENVNKIGVSLNEQTVPGSDSVNRTQTTQTAKSEEDIIASQLIQASQGFGTDETAIVNATKKIKNSNQFNKVNEILKSKGNKLDFEQIINDEFGKDDGNDLKEIISHLKTIGINSEATINDAGIFREGSFKITVGQTPTGKSSQGVKKPAVKVPAELKDIKSFQDWLDTNKAGWATGYPNGILNKAGGYGKFGPRTQSAWAKYKDEFLKGTTQPTQPTTPVQPTPEPEVSGEITTVNPQSEDF